MGFCMPDTIYIRLTSRGVKGRKNKLLKKRGKRLIKVLERRSRVIFLQLILSW